MGIGHLAFIGTRWPRGNDIEMPLKVSNFDHRHERRDTFATKQIIFLLYGVTGNCSSLFAQATNIDITDSHGTSLMVIDGDKKDDIWTTTNKKEDTITRSYAYFVLQKGD